MRARVIACIAAAAVVAAALVAARVRPVDFPSTPVLVSVPFAQPPVAQAAPSPARRQPAATRSAAPESRAAAAVLPEISKPSDLVRVVFTIKASDATPVAASRSSGTCPAAPTCDVFGTTDFRWKTDRNGTAVINYRYNDADRRDLRSPDPAAVRAAIHAAAAQWHHWDSNVVLHDAGDTTAAFAAPGADGTCADGTNVIGWGRFDDPDTVGEAGMCLDRSHHLIRDADIQLNTAYWWSIGPDGRRATYDVQEIVTHEIGHWLSLLDVYSGAASNQTMFGSADPNETRKRTPALGDVIGLQTAYPCGSGDSCPRSGIAKD